MLDFWLPILLLFVSAMAATIFNKRRRDLCLKFLNKRHVYIRKQTGKWIWGNLTVFSNALDLNYAEPYANEDGIVKESYVLFQPHINNISRILSPSPQPGTPERIRWERAVERVANPSILRRTGRCIRNIYNTLRDAFGQASTMILGTVTKKTRMGKIQTADQRAGEINRTLLDAVPNAYEPVLERYLSKQVVVEELDAGKVTEFTGILQEYTDKYLLLRSVPATPVLLNSYQGPEIKADYFDVVFPRSCTLVRHRAAIPANSK